jgi:hypothetical protein
MDKEIRILIRQKFKDGRLPFDSMAIQLHVTCFQIWDAERRAPKS